MCYKCIDGIPKSCSYFAFDMVKNVGTKRSVGLIIETTVCAL